MSLVCVVETFVSYLSAVILHTFQDFEFAAFKSFLSRCLRFFFEMPIFIVFGGLTPIDWPSKLLLQSIPKMHFVLVYKHMRPVPNPTKPCAQILIGFGTRFRHGFLIQSNTLYTCNWEFRFQILLHYIYVMGTFNFVFELNMLSPPGGGGGWYSPASPRGALLPFRVHNYQTRVLIFNAWHVPSAKKSLQCTIYSGPIIVERRQKGGFVKWWFWRTLVPVFPSGEHANVPSFFRIWRGVAGELRYTPLKRPCSTCLFSS